MFAIHTEAFEGPMDLLLKLIEKEKVDITEIEIAKITDAYLQALITKKNAGEDLTDFIDMASLLVFLKSKKLLPCEETEDEEDITEDILKQRLIQYRRYKKIALWMADRAEKRACFYARLPGDLSLYQRDKEEDFSLFEAPWLLAAYLSVKNREDEQTRTEDPFRLLKRELYPVERYVDYIPTVLVTGKRYRMTDFICRDGSRDELIAIFIALLELAKSKKIRFIQNKYGEELSVYGRED